MLARAIGKAPEMNYTGLEQADLLKLTDRGLFGFFVHKISFHLE